MTINLLRKPSKTFIFVRFQKEGIHRYPEAATDPALADVSFLANPHRHMFHFEVSVEVFHNNRDIEFIQFKRWCESLYTSATLSLNYRSCEMIAEELANAIIEKYGTVDMDGYARERDILISVSEDGENGAYVHYSGLERTLEDLA